MLIWTSRNIPNVGLFSAYAEVFLGSVSTDALEIPFLCLRRGVSEKNWDACFSSPFSLPTQRCFELRNSGLQLIGTFLCLRRGVSITGAWRAAYEDFSLPTQRCFSRQVKRAPKRPLFSAYAEVFLTLPALKSLRRAFLCLRRGVSGTREPSATLRSFSLPTQRCFFRARLMTEIEPLFSAYAEVFLLS